MKRRFFITISPRVFLAFSVFLVLIACEQKNPKEAPDVNVTDTAKNIDSNVDAIMTAISDGRLIDARQRLNSIKNEEIHQSLSDELNRAQELEIRRLATENPEQALELIITGSTGIEKFWTEVAMREFLIKDNLTARTWYQSKSKELGVEENDRFILALARYDLNEGNWRNAAKINEQVVNPEVKKAVRDEINGKIEGDS